MGQSRFVVDSSPLNESYLDLRFDDLLDRLATSAGAPGGGSAAALTVALAAALVAMVSRASRDVWADAPGVSAQAVAVKDRAAMLARRDAEVWEQATSALRSAGIGDGDADRRNFDLERKLDLAAAIPLEIAELAATTAALAATACEHGEAAYRADAVSAAALAAGGARAAAHLVEINLAVREGDNRLLRARANEQAAVEAADRVRALTE